MARSGLVLAAPRAAAPPAPAIATDDASVAASVSTILTQDVADANFGEARKKLRAILAACKGKCSGPATAQAQIALGIIAAQIGQTDEAKATFLKALEGDSMASLPDGSSAATKAAWGEAQKAWALANPPADDVAKAGWTNKEALELAKAGAAAEAGARDAECIEKDRAALSIEENARGRLHVAGCEQRAGKVIDGLRDAQKALELAVARRDTPVAKGAQQRIGELLPRIAHVTFDAPRTVTDLKVNFDERAIPTEKLAQRFAIDPGRHRARGEGSVGGVLMNFDQTYEVKDGESIQVTIKLRPTALTPGQLECMVSAKTEDDIVKCLPQQHTPLVVRAGIEVSGYTDSTSVHVLSPGLNASVVSPTQGWNVQGSYLIDMVTAASPDIVSEASRRFRDVRHAATLGGGYKPGRFGAQVNAYLSSEYDYFSRGAGLTVSGDFLDKQLTPSLGLRHADDTIGRSGRPFSVFSHTLATNEVTLGATIVMTPMSVLVVGAAMQFERGDPSKPYRYIPMFDANTSVPIGAPIGVVNQNRLPVRPLEQLPLQRDRYALTGRYISRIGNGTLRIEDRIYTDSWSLKATTADGRYMMDVSRKLRLWPHVHAHAQTGAGFYQRVYNIVPTTDTSINLPAVRTDDRELTPLLTVGLGAGGHYYFSAPGDKFQYGISLSADAMYTKFFDALFLKNRIAYYGTLGFDVEFQ